MGNGPPNAGQDRRGAASSSVPVGRSWSYHDGPIERSRERRTEAVHQLPKLDCGFDSRRSLPPSLRSKARGPATRLVSSGWRVGRLCVAHAAGSRGPWPRPSHQIEGSTLTGVESGQSAKYTSAGPTWSSTRPGRCPLAYEPTGVETRSPPMASAPSQPASWPSLACSQFRTWRMLVATARD